MYCWLFKTENECEVISNIEPLWDSQDRCYRCLFTDEDTCYEDSTTLPKGSIKLLTGIDLKPGDKPIKIKF